ncbi:MAG TPA: gamma-glutamyl-gamma-aminobutyrate hydrolase [Alphaproteobacteria bacterium]|nr:gamma-glutamyl-gamma-aminobutyrate hydrolase [Alphaproteobacteria bacterium]
MKKPLIGIILDHEEKGEYSAFPYYALRKNYFDAVENSGGVPIAIPYTLSAVERYSSLLDGLIIAGGNFDIPPAMYGDKTQHAKTTTKNTRTDFEWKMTRSFFDSGKPIMGICGGMQLLNVILGGSLIQDIETEVVGALQHEVNDRLKPAHIITIEKNTKLFEIIGKDKTGVNTSHHQAVKTLGKNVIVSAKSDDGIIEVIEVTNQHFCMGFQYHPEFLISNEDKKIFQSFIEHCQNFRQVDFWVI